MLRVSHSGLETSEWPNSWQKPVSKWCRLQRGMWTCTENLLADRLVALKMLTCLQTLVNNLSSVVELWICDRNHKQRPFDFKANVLLFGYWTCLCIVLLCLHSKCFIQLHPFTHTFIQEYLITSKLQQPSTFLWWPKDSRGYLRLKFEMLWLRPVYYWLLMHFRLYICYIII